MERPRTARGGGITGAGIGGTLASVANPIPRGGPSSQSPPPPYRGFICKAPDGAGIIGELRDSLGWTIHLAGRRGEHEGKPAYLIEGRVRVPASLRIAGLDDDA